MKNKTVVKKEEVRQRITKLDPNNNNKNLENKPLVKQRDKTDRDDGFDYRMSYESL